MKKGIKTTLSLVLLICLVIGGILVYNNFFKDDATAVSSEIEKLMQEYNIDNDIYINLFLTL